MIQELTLKGFKSFFDETIAISPLTVLTGLNSSGKSSVIQALRMIDNRGPLPGHGTSEELNNTHYSKRYSLQLKFSDSGNEVYYWGIGPEALSTKRPNGFPELIYISADRYGPRTSIPINNSRGLGERGDNVLWVIEENEWAEIDKHLRHENSEGDTFGYNLQAWLGAISPGVEFRAEIQKMSDSSFALFDDHRAMNVGFGLSYTLPVIVALFMGALGTGEVEKSAPIVLIENPEAHLHPKGQTEMARLICSAVDAGVQVIVETHSDHLFDGIRIYSKKHRGFAQKVATHWFELDKDKLTHVQSPKLNDDGSLSFWPDGLFDQFGLNASELIG